MNRCGLFLVCAVLAMSLFSCGNNKKPESKNEVKKDTVIAAVPDSTIFGVAAESGMSTLYLITNAGDTLVMDRTGEDGTYSEIYGYIMEGDSFAITKRGNPEVGYTLAKAYNLTLLNRFGVDYAIRNGLFVLDGKDTVSIKSLNSDSLVVLYPSSESKVFLPKRK